MPDPDGPSRVKNSPVAHAQLDAVQRGDIAVLLPQAGDVDRCLARWPASPAAAGCGEPGTAIIRLLYHGSAGNRNVPQPAR